MKVAILFALVAVAYASPSTPLTACPNTLFNPSLTFVCPLHKMGITPECPAISCKKILEVNPWARDGKYFIKVSTEEVIFPVFCDMTNGGYMMALRVPKAYVPPMRSADADANEKVLKPQTFVEILDTVVDLNEGKLERIMTPITDLLEPYKTRVWRLWDLIPIKKVRISLIKNKAIVKVLDFNAVGANKDTWFTKERLIESRDPLSFTDIKTTHAARVSLRSWEVSKSRREFILANPPTTLATRCTETGWMMAVNNISPWVVRDAEVSPVCPWETNITGLHVLFSKTHTVANFHRPAEIDVADAFIISVL